MVKKEKEFSQAHRSIEHMAPLLFAFTLPIFPLWLIFSLAILSVIYGGFISGKTPIKSTRANEQAKGYSIGKIAYGSSILILLILFYKQMHIVAGAWAIMALGDSWATIFGKKWGNLKWPWGEKKTILGTFAFIVFGTIGAFVLISYIEFIGQAPLGASFIMLFIMALSASIAAGIVESFELPVNDNFLVPGVGATVLYLIIRIFFNSEMG